MLSLWCVMLETRPNNCHGDSLEIRQTANTWLSFRWKEAFLLLYFTIINNLIYNKIIYLNIPSAIFPNVLITHNFPIGIVGKMKIPTTLMYWWNVPLGVCALVLDVEWMVKWWVLFWRVQVAPPGWKERHPTKDGLMQDNFTLHLRFMCYAKWVTVIQATLIHSITH